MTKKIPEGCNTLSPHLVVKDGAAAMEFYKKAFGAVEGCRLLVPGTNQLLHGSLKIGDSTLMLASEFENSECASKSPAALGGSPVTLHLYVEDVDAAFKKALAAGAKELMAPTDMFWGDRYSRLQDPFGHQWSLATHVRDVSPEEMQTAAAECFRQPQPAH